MSSSRFGSPLARRNRAQRRRTRLGIAKNDRPPQQFLAGEAGAQHFVRALLGAVATQHLDELLAPRDPDGAHVVVVVMAVGDDERPVLLPAAAHRHVELCRAHHLDLTQI